MKKITALLCLLTFLLAFPATIKASEAGRTVPHYNLAEDGGKWDGTQYHKKDGSLVTDAFFCDGEFTYYLQADGTPMKDKLTYHPDGEHLIYLDGCGHEVFNDFRYCISVGYTCYFDVNGYLYKDEITFVGDKVYYLNKNGAMEQNGWFQFANGCDYGYAMEDGSLITNQYGYDNQNRVVFYHWNGMIARGLITDSYWYYNFDETDGHYVGRFRNEGQADANSYQRQVLDLVNEERLSRNIAPLLLNTTVQSAAQIRSTELVSYYSHTRPNGTICYTALYDVEFGLYGAAGENIAAGYTTPQKVMEGWMNSPGHRANILNSTYKEMGVGYTSSSGGKYKHYWVQMFVGE